MLKNRHLARAELIGQFLHRRGNPMQMAIIANRHDDIQLTRSEIHNGLLRKTRSENARAEGSEIVRLNITLTDGVGSSEKCFNLK